MKASLLIFLIPFLVADAGLVQNLIVRPIRTIFDRVRPIFQPQQIVQTPEQLLQGTPFSSLANLEERLNSIDAQLSAWGSQINLPIAPAPAHQEQGTPQEHSSSGGHSHFGYDENDGPDTWHEHFPACGGLAQSPIDINENILEHTTLPPLVRENYWSKPLTMELENNGHTLEISGEWPEGEEPTISGGPLNGRYRMKQLHIHWGMDDSTGSEHTVNGKSMPMEMHVVHWNEKYGSFAEAVKQKDGLAVTGFFFAIGLEENAMMEKFVKEVRNVEGSESRHVDIEPMPINILNLDFDSKYVTYEGSLTTPPCSEVVTWLVSTEPLLLSAEQMQVLRGAVKDSDGDAMHNYRPPQPLNGRSVYMIA